jgi:hypothetical protein
LVVALGVVVGPLMLSVGALLAIPQVEKSDRHLRVRSWLGRTRIVELALIEAVSLTGARPPWPLVLLTGWPVPASFPTVACIVRLKDGTHLPLDALQAVRLPLLGFAITQSPVDARVSLATLGLESS